LKRILVTGAGGQIGSWLVPRLRELYGSSRVLATDVRHSGFEAEEGPFRVVDATNADHTEPDIDRVLQLLGAYAA
jgi:nucleoside-diphosphate-sugar epimerase